MLESERSLVVLDEQPRIGEERWIRMAVLKGEHVLLRPGRPEDADSLVRIRDEPELARWWGNAIEGEVEEALVRNDEGFVIEVDGEVGGSPSLDLRRRAEPSWSRAHGGVLRDVLPILTSTLYSLSRILAEVYGRLTISWNNHGT